MAIANELTINTSATAMDMANAIFGDGITVVSAGYTGDAASSGIYSGATTTIAGVSPTDSGVILSTGRVTDFTNSSGTTNTNTQAGMGNDMAGGVDGDAQLNTVAGAATYDGAILTASFIPEGDVLTMQFVFSSEEYPEYVNQGYNDVIGVWVNGQYVQATISTSGQISIDTVNPTSNQNLYHSNAADTYNTEMDGVTLVLSIKAPVNAGQVNTIKIAIADGGDAAYDSNLLIMGDSVQTYALAFDDTVQLTANSTRTFDILGNDRDMTDGGLTITKINGVSVVPGQQVTLPTGERVTLNANGTITVQSDSDIGQNNFTYEIVDSEGNTDVGYVTVKTVSTTARDGIVQGTAAGDLIDTSYLGDPDGDRIDNNDATGFGGTTGNADYVIAGAGDDTVNSGAGNDIVFGGAGADSVTGGAGNDWAALGDGNDRFGTAGDDAGNDTVYGDGGNDTIDGGSGDDRLYGGAGNDQLTAGSGNDLSDGDAGDDRFVLTDGFGSDTIIGGEDGQTTGDVLDLSGLTGAVRVNLTSANPETGSVTQGANSAGFTEIETIQLGNATETLVLGDGSGADQVQGFTAPTLNPDGSYTGVDQLDVSALHDAGGAPVRVDDVTVGDDGNGNAVLHFPNGESLVLVGVSPSAVSSPLALVAMGIPANPDGIVDGTAGDDLMNPGYVDPQTDQIDGWDGDADTIKGYGGNDTIRGGAAGDVVYGGTGADSVEGGAGNDTLHGDEGNDLLAGGDGDDRLYGGDNDDVLIGDIGNDTLEGGAGVDSIYGGAGDDSVVAGDDGDLVLTDEGNDTIDAGAGDDTVFAGLGDDSVLGGDGHDNIETEAGNDTVDAGEGNDTIRGMAGEDSLSGGGGDDSINGGDDNDTIDGGDGHDALEGDAGNDSLTGGAGNDSMGGGYGDDTLRAGEGDDDVYGGPGNDLMQGEDGNDTLRGGIGTDLIEGGDGDDLIWGEAGNDTMYGGAGNDTILGGDDRDYIYGGPGDFVSGSEGGDDYDVLDLTAYGHPATNIIYDTNNHENGTVEFLDGDGNVVSTMQFINIEKVIACFTPGTRILTDQGERVIETLAPGDMVLTRDNGWQPLRWIGRRDMTQAELMAEPRFNPIRIAQGALGEGLPQRDMLVSPQHRMLLAGPRAELLFGEHEVLAAATHLVGTPGIERVMPRTVSYIHLMFDHHEIIHADGAWSESFQPGEATLEGLGEDQRAELLALFPDLAQSGAYPAARITLKGREAKVLLSA